MLRTHEDQPHIHAVNIKGVDGDIPRINPEHFSREESLAVIMRSTAPAEGQALKSSIPALGAVGPSGVKLLVRYAYL